MQFLFEDRTLDIDRRELRRGSQQIAVEPQVFDLLVYLVQNRQRVVTKDDLLNSVWSGRLVSESTLTSRINAARKAIGDSGEEQRLIRTVPRKGFRFVGVVSTRNAKDVPAETTRMALPLPDKPSIAVLPFENMSGDPEQEYFADGIVEEIITALTRFRQLFVIARNSTFTYKHRAVDVKQVGCQLGVRYVLEGSVRKSANQLRISAQLIDAISAVHLWADRFDGGLDKIFDLQDQVTGSVVGAIAPTVGQAEIERAKRKPAESLDAYDYYLRGLASYYQPTRSANEEALRLFYKSIELDPEFASPHARAAICYTTRKQSGWMADFDREVVEGTRLAREAVKLGRDDAVALSAGGFSLAYLYGDLDAGATFIDRAITLNPNLAGAWLSSGLVRMYLGEPDVAIDHFTRAKRLSPLGPGRQMEIATAMAHFFAGRYEQAGLQAGKVLSELPSFVPALRVFAASCAMTGRLKEAQRATARVRELNPTWRVSNVKDVMPLRRPEDLARYQEALRKAGMPE